MPHFKILLSFIVAVVLGGIFFSCSSLKKSNHFGGEEGEVTLPSVKDSSRAESDSDRDGVPDKSDRCPNVPGYARYNGCPIPDTDGDGVNDELDKCPETAGESSNGGCPLTDKDIIYTEAVGYASGATSAKKAHRKYTVPSVIENSTTRAEMPAAVLPDPGRNDTSVKASLAYAYRKTIPLNEYRNVSVIIDAGKLLDEVKSRLGSSLGEERAKAIRSDDTSIVEGFLVPAAKWYTVELQCVTSDFDTISYTPSVQTLDENGRIEWRWSLKGKRIVKESPVTLTVYYSNAEDKIIKLSSQLIQIKINVESKPSKWWWLLALLGTAAATTVAVWLMTNRTKRLKKKIYFSYAWGNTKPVVISMYNSLKKSGCNVFRDDEDLKLWGSITQFMTDIGKADLALVMITDKYLKSKFCMYELYEIYRNSDMDEAKFKTRILPIRLEEIDLSDLDVQQGYIDYWEAKQQKWEKKMQENTDTLTVEQVKQYQVVKRIVDEIGNLLIIIADLNASTMDKLSENDFVQVKSAIQKALRP